MICVVIDFYKGFILRQHQADMINTVWLSERSDIKYLLKKFTTQKFVFRNTHKTNVACGVTASI